MAKNRKYRNKDDDDMPRIFGYYPYIALTALLFFGACLGVGLYKGIDWLVTMGVIILAVTIAVMSLSKTLWFFWMLATVSKELEEEDERKKAGKPSPEDEYKQFSAYYDCDENNNANIENNESGEIAERCEPREREGVDSVSCDSKTEPAKEQSVSSYESISSQSDSPSDWSASDRAKVYAIVFPIAITLLTFMVGIFFANLGIESVGFPLMGAGGGGFALIIVLLIVISNVKERRRNNPRPRRERKSKSRDSAPAIGRSASERRPTEILRRGTVVDCQTEKPRTRKGSAATSYKVGVRHGEAQNYITLASSKQFEAGDTVKFYQSCEHPDKCRLAEFDE